MTQVHLSTNRSIERQVRPETRPPGDDDREHLVGLGVRRSRESASDFLADFCHRWLKSTTFATYMLSRIIGGLSEGNVQLAM